MMRIFLFFAWYDLWIGAFWYRKEHKLYVCPVPMFGILFDFGWAKREHERLHRPFNKQPQGALADGDV